MTTYCLQQYWKHLSTNLCLQFCWTWFFSHAPHSLSGAVLFVLVLPPLIWVRKLNISTLCIFVWIDGLENSQWIFQLKHENGISAFLHIGWVWVCPCMLCTNVYSTSYIRLFIHTQSDMMTWMLFVWNFHAQRMYTEISRQQKIKKERK